MARFVQKLGIFLVLLTLVLVYQVGWQRRTFKVPVPGERSPIGELLFDSLGLARSSAHTELLPQASIGTDKQIHKALRLVERGSCAAALEVFTTVVRENPELVIGYLLRGVTNLHAGRLEAAEFDISFVLERDSDNDYANLVRALIRRQRGNNVGALADLILVCDQEGMEVSCITEGLLRSGSFNPSGREACRIFREFPTGVCVPSIKLTA